MILRALFLRPLRRSPLRFTATVLGVAGAVAAVVATLASSRAAVAALREGVGELAGAARLELSAPAGVSELALAGLRSVGADAQILPVMEELVLCPALDDSVRLLGIDPLVDPAARGLELTAFGSGADSAAHNELLLRTLRGQGVWLSTGLAHELGLAAGGTLELVIRAHRVPLTVLGTFDPPKASTGLERLVVADLSLVQELTGRIGRVDRIEFVPRRGVELEELQARVQQDAPAGAIVRPVKTRGLEAAAMVRSLEFNLAAVSGISLFVAAVLVATTLATSVVQRRATIALFVSLGASRAQIVRAVLFEALCIGVLGGGLGVLAGFTGAELLVERMRATVAAVVAGAPKSAIHFDAGEAWLGFGLAVCFALAAAVLPAIECLSTPPVQGLRGEQAESLGTRSRLSALALAAAFGLSAGELVRLPAWNGLPLAALASGLCLLGVMFCVNGPLLDFAGDQCARIPRLIARAPSLRLATAALAAGRRRAAWAAGAVGVAVALAISIATLVHSFRSTMVDWTEAAMHADVSVRPRPGTNGIPLGRLDPALVQECTELFGAQCVDTYHSIPAHIGSARVALGARSFAIGVRRGGEPYRDGRDARMVLQSALSGHGAVIDEAMALRFGLNEGDLLALDTQGGHFERRIEGVFQDYGDSQGLALIDRADFLALCPDDGPRYISLFLPPKSDPQAARKQILARTSGRYELEVITNAELKRQVLGVFDQTFAITRALQAVAAIVAVIAVLTVVFALVRERRADLALISALGASRGQVASSVALQAGLLGVYGSLSGAVAGIGIGVLLVTVVNLQSFGWTLDLHLPGAAIVGTLLIVALASLIAGLAPALSVAREPLRAVLHEEG